MSEEDNTHIDVGYVIEEILRMDEIPENGSREYETFIEDLGIPQWADEFQGVLHALEKRRGQLQLERIEKKLDNINKIERLADKIEDDSLEILKKRYAKGELSKDEFEKMKKDLEE